MKYIIQKQVRENTINFVTGDTPQWEKGDGMYTKDTGLALVAYAADCALIAFWDSEHIGICHAGWPGYSMGLVRDMAALFPSGKCAVAPFLHSFEIKKDFAYDDITTYSDDRFLLDEGGKIMFDFKSAIIAELEGMIEINMDPRSTMDHLDLGSWRRDQKKGDGTQNRLAIWRHDEKVLTNFFPPGEGLVTAYFENHYY